MKRVLMIAYHFPPMAGSSGLQRTLGFVRDLEQFGWEPMVLTAQPRAYEDVSDDLMKEIPDKVTVRRAFALDTARHLSLFNRYPRSIALPDRWISWLAGAIPAGLRMIRQKKPDILWSTFPIATAHIVGDILTRLAGIPWVADFRDPMAHEGYPPDPRVWRSYLKVEQRVFARARRMTFTTSGAARFYGQRYPDAASRCIVVPNGYDERSFGAAEASAQREPLNPGSVTIVHSGVVYPAHRDPEQLFAALRAAFDAETLPERRVRLWFRAPVYERFVRELAIRYRLDGIVAILPAITYQDALQEMLRADGLLILQAADCNDQIPAKLYEYMRARRPVMGLTDDAGDTASALRAAGFHHLAPLDSPSRIRAVLASFVADIESGTAPLPSDASIESSSRRGSARLLSEIFDQVRHERNFPLSQPASGRARDQR
ncbi:MAG TPA: glycosyltransferase [Candidatus Eremiobacteraceae bacterium]|nr:glycosyltransferase [Candidatus Eremiobacteraceae bacterium]